MPHALRLNQCACPLRNFIKDVPRPTLDLFVTAYLDDILISENLRGHKIHVRQVLTALKENGPHFAPYRLSDMRDIK